MNKYRTVALGACLLGVLAAIAVSGCQRRSVPAGAHADEEEAGQHDETAEHSDDGEQHAEGEAEPEGETRLHLDDVRGVSFATVGQPRDEGAWFAAEAVAEEGALAVLSAPVSGVIAAFRAAPGTSVRSGQPLLDIRSPELADLKSRWLSARARLVRAESELGRERRLFEVSATSQRDVEAAEADLAVARADGESARLALTARGVTPEASGAVYTLRAPQAGSLAVWSAALGESVASGQELGRLLAGGATLAQVDLALPGPAAWSVGAVTEVRRSDGKRWEARVEGVPSAVSANTGRLSYRLRLTGVSELPMPGTPLEARVPLGTAIVLPQTALQQIEGTWGVFVRDGDFASFRPVRRGAELGGDVLVLEGVAPGEIVADNGAYLLKALYLKVSGGGEAHDH